MTKFKVGDKVTCIKDYTHFTQGEVYKIQNIDGKIITLLDNDIEQNDWCVEDFNKHFEIVPTKNQRITALENEVTELRPLKQEVAELKLIVHELRGKKSIEPSITNPVEDIIEFEGNQYRKVDREAQEGDVAIFYGSEHPQITDDKVYIIYQNHKEGYLYHIADSGTDYILDGEYVGGYYVYELIESKPLRPNQQRAEIIEKAKKFVDEKGEGFDYSINDDKRILAFNIRTEKVAFAKCSPNDVFNEHIGKAISLGRALNLDVSEFEQAVQPTFAKGQLIEGTTKEQPSANLGVRTCYGAEGDNVYTNASLYGWYHAPNTKIINDTKAIYGGAE